MGSKTFIIGSCKCGSIVSAIDKDRILPDELQAFIMSLLRANLTIQKIEPGKSAISMQACKCGN